MLIFTVLPLFMFLLNMTNQSFCNRKRDFLLNFLLIGKELVVLHFLFYFLLFPLFDCCVKKSTLDNSCVPRPLYCCLRLGSPICKTSRKRSISCPRDVSGCGQESIPVAVLFSSTFIRDAKQDNTNKHITQEH